MDETPPPPKTSPLEDDELVEEEAIEVKPKNINEALKDENWVMVMQEELNQFKTNNVWELVLNPMDMDIIGTKWVYRNKLDENGVVTRNKSRLIAQGYNQQEGIDYDETYAPVARLESIRILLAYACALDFKLYQMDVKSAFLNGFINEEVYVAQPPGFINFAKPNYVYKLKKALYDLKQAPKAWHKNWLVHKQTACGKDFSNPFMVDNLPKIVRLSTHLASVVKSWLVHDQTVHALASPKANELAIPEQTATGKGTSNPLMAGSLPKTTKPT
ncbi:retrovirus-related pol polyprotein from transposon TNT 1-94 [Tanacetum coccineum]